MNAEELWETCSRSVTGFYVDITKLSSYCSWPDNCQVIPEFLALLGQRPSGNGVLIHAGENLLTALAWFENKPLPQCVLVMDKNDSNTESLTREIIERTGLESQTSVVITTGEFFEQSQRFAVNTEL
jgi:hypothetical protein